VGIERWWRTNRRAAPELFREDLEQAIVLLESTPTAGSPASDATLVGVRRVLLRRCRYHLYYRLEGEAVQVLAIWHAMRLPPKL